MAGRECYHCKQWVEAGEAHNCWTTTEAALTQDLSEDLRDAWERIRETAAAFGDQRIYASGRCIMFSRTACYFFVRPKRSVLEVCFFLGRTVKAPQVRRTDPASRTKIAHIAHVRHRDEVEAPLADWLLEAYESSDALSGRTARQSPAGTRKTTADPTPEPEPKPKPTKKTKKKNQQQQRKQHTRKQQKQKTAALLKRKRR